MSTPRVPESVPDARARIRSVLDVAIRLAIVLLGSGAGAQECTEAMSAVCRAYGVRRAQADVTHTLLSLTWTNPSTNEPITRQHKLPVRTLDNNRLTAAAALHAQIVAGHLDLPDARRRIARIAHSRPLTPPVVRRLGWGLVGAGAAVLLDGGWLVAAVAFIAAFLMDALLAFLGARGVPLLFQTLLGGAIGPLAAAAVILIRPDASATLIVVGTIIVLLAGVTVFGAVQDILTAYYVTGIARLTEAVVATTGIAAGVVGTAAILDRLGVPIAIQLDQARPLHIPLIAMGAAIVMAVGFAVATQLPWRALWCVLVLAILAEGVTLLAGWGAFSAIAGAAVTSVVVGVAASPLARLVHVPSLPMIIAALVPMLPGLLLFNGMMQLAGGAVEGLLGVAEAAAVAGALSAGAICGHYIVRLARGPARALRLSKL